MSFWTRRARNLFARNNAADPPEPEVRRNIGEYQHLYKYLLERFAIRVVLTFGEIEDLLGFPLPAAARLGQEWWNATDPLARRSAQADAWTLASRTAVVNMVAQSVVFERQMGLEPSRVS